jgi:hypothetical protein
MQINLKSIVVSSVVFCATAAFAANQAQVNVPFGFTAEGQSYPAGSYSLSLDASYDIVTMTSKTDATKHISWSVSPAEEAAAPAIVKFDHVGADYALKTIQLGEHVTPVLDKNFQQGVSASTSISGQ